MVLTSIHNLSGCSSVAADRDPSTEQPGGAHVPACLRHARTLCGEGRPHQTHLYVYHGKWESLCYGHDTAFCNMILVSCERVKISITILLHPFHIYVLFASMKYV